MERELVVKSCFLWLIMVVHPLRSIFANMEEPTWKIPTMCYRVGILPLSTPAHGFMLHVTMIIVL
ncbi:hypothetical protein CsSME_00035356 [Camellia sinensis var. sinensis]